MAVVYGIRAQDSDQYFYVGCTIKTARERLAQHLEQVQYGCHVNRHFANKVKKVEARNVIVDVLETTEDGQQFDREQWWIEHLLGQGVKLTNLVHNGMAPFYSRPGLSKYSLSNNWEWAKAWYADFQRGYALQPERPEDDQIMLLAQRILSDVIGQILSAPPEQQQALIGHFE